MRDRDLNIYSTLSPAQRLQGIEPFTQLSIEGANYMTQSYFDLSNSGRVPLGRCFRLRFFCYNFDHLRGENVIKTTLSFSVRTTIYLKESQNLLLASSLHALDEHNHQQITGLLLNDARVTDSWVSAPGYKSVKLNQLTDFED